MPKKPVVNWAVLAPLILAFITAWVTLNRQVSALEVRVEERKDAIARIETRVDRTDENVADLYRSLLGREPKPPKARQQP